MATEVIAVPTLTPRQLREELHLSRERMARLLDVSAKTIERLEARDELPASRAARQRLAQIQEIVKLGRVVYTPHGIDLFLTTPMPVFDNHTALQLIELGQGDRVFAALAEDYEGLGF
jgi:DNA-binding XRE family transcriptional regulator